LDFWSDPIILEFLLGVVLGLLRRRYRTMPSAVCVMLLLAGFASCFSYLVLPGDGDYWQVLRVALPVTMIVAGVAFLRVGGRHRASRTLVFGGDTSYALYLSHPFAITAVALLLDRLPTSVGVLFLPLALAVALVGAVVTHVYVERPLTAKLSERFLGRRPVETVAVV
jgi:peptidoglycan/LPS O-acetylase OafA/YrhL